MPRVPKGKGGLSAGERARIYEQARAEKRRRLSQGDFADKDSKIDGNKKAILDNSEVLEQIAEQPQCNEAATPKKTLPNPEVATVKVDFSVDVGEIGEMHGFCNGPVSYGTDISGLFKEIGVPVVRFDNTDGANSAYAVDISRIFKDFSADPNDPKSYDFSVTDKYITAAYNSGAKVILRLGESRDKLGCDKRVDIPESIDLWINVCANVIRHYNDYFANGYAFGIDKFEIWSHDYSLDGSDWAKEFELYHRVASTVKMIDPSLSVGGMLFRGLDGAAREFIRFCRKNRSPLDFLTLSIFASDPKEVSEEINDAIAYLKNQGFADTELIVGEWGYADADALSGKNFHEILMSGSDGDKKRAIFESQSSIKGSAFAAATMLELNSSGNASAACFCDAQPMVSPFTSICDRFGKAQKPFYAFQAYGKLFRAGNSVFCRVESPEGYAHSGIYASAARATDGECYIMIASCGGCGTVDLRIDEIADTLYTADIYLLDGVKDLSLGSSTPLSGSKKRMILNVCEYGAVLIKLY